MRQETAASQATQKGSRPIWFDAFLVGVGVLVVFALTGQYHDPLNIDSRGAALAAWQLAHHGNATLTAFSSQTAWLYHVGDRWVTNRMPGSIFWATPFYAVVGGNHYPPVYPGTIAAAVASAAAIAFTFALCTRLVSHRAALAAALLLAFATGTWTVSADQLWTHGPAQMAVLLTVLLCSQRRWLLAGIPAGFAVLVRPHLAVVAIVIAAYAIVRLRSARPLLIGVGGVIGSAILLAYNHALWGKLEIFGGYDQPVSPSDHKALNFVVGIAGDLISPERGLLVMTPALLLLLPGIRRAWAVAPDWVRSAAIAGLAYLALQLWGIRFWGGDGFYSYRTTLETLTLCVPLLVLAWREWTAKSRARDAAFAGLAVLSVGIHAFGALVNWTPPGIHSPWRMFLPLDLMHHIGFAQSAAWIAVTVYACLAAVILSLRRRSSNDSQLEGQPRTTSSLLPSR
jgi:alpha-1,2-mannosyltransferase